MASRSMRNEAAVDLRRDVDSIKDDIAMLKTDVVAAMRDLTEAGKHEAGEAKEKLEAAVRDRLERLGDAAQGMAERGRRVVDTAEKYVEERPLQSLAIAFGVGLLVGAVLRK